MITATLTVSRVTRYYTPSGSMHEGPRENLDETIAVTLPCVPTKIVHGGRVLRVDEVIAVAGSKGVTIACTEFVRVDVPDIEPVRKP